MNARPAALADLPALLEIALDKAQMYPHLTPEPDKIRDLLRTVLSSKQCFARVIERDGRVVSGLLANSGSHGWARKSFSQIMLWWSGQRGDGRQLLRAYMAWIDSRPVIRSAGLYLDFDAPQWLAPFMQSEGFAHTGGALQWYRG